MRYSEFFGNRGKRGVQASRSAARHRRSPGRQEKLYVQGQGCLAPVQQGWSRPRANRTRYRDAARLDPSPEGGQSREPRIAGPSRRDAVTTILEHVTIAWNRSMLSASCLRMVSAQTRLRVCREEKTGF